MRRSRETFELAWEQEWLIVAVATCDKLEQAVPEPRRYEDKGECAAVDAARTCSNKSGTAAGLSSLRRWQACFFVPEASKAYKYESEEHEHDEHDFYG